MRAGEHPLKAFIYYDEKMLELQAKFRIGDLDTEFVSYTSNATAGQINRVTAVVRSLWSSPLSSYITFALVKDAKVLVETKSQTIELRPWEREEIEMYIDATNIPPGTYTGEYRIYFSGKSKEAKTPFELFPAPVLERPEPSGGFTLLSLQSLLVTVIVLLILLILVLLLRKPPRLEVLGAR